jgi:hypothetical protein
MRAVTVLALCLGAAFVCAFAYVVILHSGLPPSDEAYDIPLLQFFSDPFVLTVAGFGVLLCGLISFPFAYIALRNRRLATSALFVVAAVLGEILLITPIALSYGFYGTIPTLAAALLVCRYSGWKIFAKHS